jgi:hypothetical protein
MEITMSATEIALREAKLREQYWISLKEIERTLNKNVLTDREKVFNINKIINNALYGNPNANS